MESSNINIKNLTKISEKEFQQHFRDWMERDDVARSLQAKLRKDLIANFNKTSLGKQIIAQTGVSHRLNLSPLLLALNTLAAEFLYAQNCHFTLSVFCTEVPYRNTLPDFESAHHFRFSEREIFEILDALSSKSSNFDMETKQSICKEYNKKNYSLLFVVLKNLLSIPMGKTKSKLKENGNEKQPIASIEEEEEEKEVPQKSSHRIMPKTIASATASEKLNSKVEYQSKNFRYLNKYLMILSRKMKEMSVNLDLLQKQQNHHHHESAPNAKTVKKSLQARKFENLNRNLEKISENLRHLSLSKRKNKRLASVVTAVNAMAMQFEKCLSNFDQLSKGIARGGGQLGAEKSYSDWIHEMRTSNNGKLCLEKIESSLRKAIHRERNKMETELKQRMQIQKDILRSKYNHKLTEELALSTSRTKIDNSHQTTNEIFEKKLNEFEAKHKELHLKIQEAEKRITTESSAKNVQSEQEQKPKSTQTANDITSNSIQNLANEQNQIQQMIKHISDQERQVDHIVFDAKLRVQELEHESNQLDRTFRDYLERQRCEKLKIREHATSIWQNYALGKSMIDTKSNSRHRLTASSKMEKHPVNITFDRTTPPDLTIPTISIDDVSATLISPPAEPVFENPFRVAKRKILKRTKKTYSKPSAAPLPSPQQLKLPHTDSDEEDNDGLDDSSAENCTQDKRKQRPTVLQLIEHKDIKEGKVKMIRTKIPSLLPNGTTNANNGIKLAPATQGQSRSPEFNIDDITLDGIELSPTTNKSSSIRSGDSNSSSRGVFKLKRQLFATDNVVEANGRQQTQTQTQTQQINSNDDSKELKESLPQKINNHQSVDDVKKSYASEGQDNNFTLKL